MTTLVLSRADQIHVRSSWADVMAKNHFDDQNFVNLLFSNLMDADQSVKKVFRNKDDLKEQEKCFADILKFIMMYLDKPRILSECMDAFIQENPSVVRFGVDYLEPMGAIIIKSLRQVLGTEKFHAGLETLWIKVYIYLANCILLHDMSDVEPEHATLETEDSPLEQETFTPKKLEIAELESKEEAHEEEIKPLNFKSFSSPVPAFKSKSITSDTNTISINLGSNEKYRGFRRSVSEFSKSTVSVAVPSSFSSTPSPISVASMEEPTLTPRSQKRNSVLQLQELGYGLEVSLNQDKALENTFDPRRRSHKRTPSEININIQKSERSVSSSSCESPVSDVDDHLQLIDEEEMKFSPSTESRAAVFDSNSFGIKGLAPIAESEDDENSTYSNENVSTGSGEKHSEDESSSRTSSLSLHHLDYKSSISSGTGHSVYEKSPKTYNASSNASQTRNHMEQYSSPYSFNAYLSSVPSLISRSSGQRASMGFMRSSYVLKKEMNEMGYNHAENVASVADFSAAPKPKASNPYALPRAHHSEIAVNTVELQLPGYVKSLSSKNSDKSDNSTIRSTKSSKHSVQLSSSGKLSFRQKLSNLFGSSSGSASAPRRKISQPIAVQKNVLEHSYTGPTEKPRIQSCRVPTPATEGPPRRPTSRQAPSIAPSVGSTRRVSSIDVRGMPSSASYAQSMFPKHSMASDNASMVSASSGKSGFSLFKSRNKKEQSNKYLVKKVPYKTIYLKDIIS